MGGEMPHSERGMGKIFLCSACSGHYRAIRPTLVNLTLSIDVDVCWRIIRSPTRRDQCLVRSRRISWLARTSSSDSANRIVAKALTSGETPTLTIE